MHGTKMRLGHELRNIINLIYVLEFLEKDRGREGERKERRKEGGKRGGGY